VSCLRRSAGSRGSGGERHIGMVGPERFLSNGEGVLVQRFGTTILPDDRARTGAARACTTGPPPSPSSLAALATSTRGAGGADTSNCGAGGADAWRCSASWSSRGSAYDRGRIGTGRSFACVKLLVGRVGRALRRFPGAPLLRRRRAQLPQGTRPPWLPLPALPLADEHGALGYAASNPRSSCSQSGSRAGAAEARPVHPGARGSGAPPRGP
jgi:hypothetical protein